MAVVQSVVQLEDVDSVVWDHRVDLVVVGAGVAGMTAALVGAIEGLNVLMLEKTSQVGGTSAYSSGTVWIPDNHHMATVGMHGDRPLAKTYLSGLIGQKLQEDLIDAFLESGPEMISFMEKHTPVVFKPYRVAPDYHQEVMGAASGGRTLEPVMFDGRELGEHFDRVRAPIPELTLLGGMMLTRGEAATLLDFKHPFRSAALGAKLLARYAMDRLKYARGTRLVIGNALVARLFKGLLNSGVNVLYECDVHSLFKHEGRIVGIGWSLAGRRMTASVSRGVVMAGGGFPASSAKRAEYLPEPTAPYTAACAACTGQAQSLAVAAGAEFGPPARDNALWFPSSVAPREDGSLAVYPHIVLDRAKPGVIAVNAQGKRFLNEAVSYHEFTRAMYRAHRTSDCIPAYLVCDSDFVWKYGLGMILPRTLRLAPYIRRGYLFTGPTLADLAVTIGLPGIELEKTVTRYNDFVRKGHDEDFGKGSTLYERTNGDADVKPNPCLGPIRKGPFYAVRIWPTPLGTSIGLRTNANAQVLSVGAEPIPGLYACGNDMNSIFSGHYPGAGAQLGPGMTFGYIAARHALTNEMK